MASAEISRIEQLTIMKRILVTLILPAFLAMAGAAEQGAQQAVQQPAQQVSAPVQRLVRKAAAPERAPQAAQIANPQIDFAGHVALAEKIGPLREQRRVTEAQFMAMALQPGTIVLDARSPDKYRMRHIKGAINLPFTDFTAEELAKVIPAKDTPILIYCNNNLRNAVSSAPEKRATVALNISTYVNLAAYGYTNVWELGPNLDVKTAKVPFAGTEVGN